MNYSDNNDEILLDGSNLAQRNIISEINKFDLDLFFHSKGASSGAIGLITKKQSIFTDTFVRLKKHPNYGSHIEAVSAVYKVIYKNYPEFVYTENPLVLNKWQDFIINDGNILIQLCEPQYDLSMIWLPSDITDYQLKEVVRFNEKLKKIVSNDLDYFNEFPIGFACTYNNFFELYNSLDELISNIKQNKICKKTQYKI